MRRENAIVIYPKINSTIANLRKKYDKNWKFMKPHITLVYPFHGIRKQVLRRHIKWALKNSAPFEIELRGLKKSKKDFYLYLLCKGGSRELVSLHKRLHRNLLKEFRNQDMPKYIPHVTLGRFSADREIENAILKLNKKNLRCVSTIQSIYLLTFEIKNHIPRLVASERIKL